MKRKIEKPWGYEEILEANSRYVVKKLFIKEGCRLSKQYHMFKHETLYLISGKSIIHLEEVMIKSTNDKYGIEIKPGNYMIIEPGKIHRIEAIEDSIFLEASTPELWDVERLEDDYDRA